MITGRPILMVEQVQKSFGGVTAVRGPSFTIEEGKVTGIIGPNGSGKSPLFNLLTGVDHADHGSILFRGRHIEHLPSHRIARMGIGRTFQLVRVFAHMTVLENLVVAALHGSMAQNRTQAEALLEEFGIAQLRDEEAANLSYGQQKLLEFSRLLMNRHDLILLDEPFAGVNRTTANILVDRIRSLQSDGVTVLITDHEMRIIMEICQTLMVLDNGELIAEGPPAEVRDDERVLAAYFGR